MLVSDVLIYKAKDGHIELDVNLSEETVWLNQKQLSELFDKNVRTISEHQQFSIPGSMNLPLQEIGAASNRLNKDKPVMLYCQSGARSEQAKSFLKSMGFNQVYNLGSVLNYFNC